MPSSFTHTRRVEFNETDMAGIVHFANFHRYMEEAEHAFFRSLGLSIMRKDDEGAIIGWPRVSCSANFKAPAFFEDVLEITLRIERRGVKSLCWEIEVRRGETLICTGKMKTVCCRFAKGEPMVSIAIPPEYDVLEEEPAKSDG